MIGNNKTNHITYRRGSKCKNCGGKVPRRRLVYCSVKCKLDFYKKLNPHVKNSNVHTSITTGAISELITSVDLLSKGYAVFRALSSSCPCDLIILKNGTVLKIEVRTTHINPSGKMARSTNKKDNKLNIDHYARVLPHTVVYEPPLPAIISIDQI